MHNGSEIYCMYKEGKIQHQPLWRQMEKMQLAEVTKLTSLIREKIILIIFI